MLQRCNESERLSRRQNWAIKLCCLRQFEVNALGPLRVVSALQGALVRGSKVAIITSKMGSITETAKGGMVRHAPWRVLWDFKLQKHAGRGLQRLEAISVKLSSCLRTV